MGSIVDGFDATFPDYNTPGVPASGAAKPDKAEIRDLGQTIEDAISIITSSGATVIYAAKSSLDADLAHAAGTIGLVYDDASAANNGIYVKSGASGSGSWTLSIPWGTIEATLDTKADQADVDAIEAELARNLGPIDFNGLTLVRRSAQLTSNTSSHATKRADGNYDYVSGLNAYWDRALTADEIAAGAVWIEMEHPSGTLTACTVQQRSASAETVAPVTIPDITGRRYLEIDLDGATTVLRITVTASSSGVIGPPAVGTGKPVRVPVDPYYLAALLFDLAEDDGPEIGTLTTLGASSGTVGTIVDTHTFTVPSGSINNATFDVPSDVLSTDSLTVLVKIDSVHNAPRAVQVAPVAVDGTVGTLTGVPRQFQSSQYLVTTISAAVGGLDPSGVRVQVNTASGGNDGSAVEDVTIKAWIYKSTALPKIRTVPAVIQQSIDAVSDDVDDVEATATAAAAAAEASAESQLSYEFMSRIDARVFDLREAVKFVDKVTGSDSTNDGATPLTPYATIDKAVAETVDGDIIALRGGQEHFATIPAAALARSFVPYGYATVLPTIDSRRDLSGATWTAVAGTDNCWQTTVVGRDTTWNNGTSSDSWSYRLWFAGNVRGDWKVGGANIAANIDNVDAEPGSYTVYQNGSTVQDPRSDTNATTYVWVVHMPDGSDPNGQDVRISDQQQAWRFADGVSRDIRLIGGSRKDFAGSNGYVTDFPVFDGAERIDFSQHGHVGPCTVRRTYYAKGWPQPGTVPGDQYGRCEGGALNLYSGTDHTDRDVEIDTVDLHNCTSGLYGHGSGNYLYNDVTVQKLKGSNLSTAVQFDPRNGTTYEAVIAGLLTIEDVDVEDVDNLISGGGVSVINGGNVAFSENGYDSSQTLVTFTTASPDVTINNLTWTFPLPTTGGRQNCLYARTLGLTFDTPILRLNNCVDASPIGQKGSAYRTGTYSWKIELHLTGGTKIGDIVDPSGTTANYPLKLFVDAGCEFGFAGLNGPGIDSFLASQGLTEGTDYSISGDCTVVDRNGNILSRPGWK
ncbi:MAG: hypothetical protein GC201_00955 [Alphaproteobacteria bacterium]|nr:hypothetical protein [Alphaproteobacteria bacterium]